MYTLHYYLNLGILMALYSMWHTINSIKQYDARIEKLSAFSSTASGYASARYLSPVEYMQCSSLLLYRSISG